MAAAGRVATEIQKHLQSLADAKYADSARLAVTNVAECLKLNMTADEIAIVLQQLMSVTAPLSVLSQLRAFGPKKEYDLVRADLLKLLNEHVLPQVGVRIKPYTTETLKLVLKTIRTDTSGKAKEEAFQTFVLIQRLNLDLSNDPDFVEPATYIKTFFDELGIAKSKQSQGVRGALLSTLGQLSDLYPNQFSSYAKKLAELYTATLEEQLASSVKKEQKKLLEGVLIGMKYFLIHHSDLFPRDAKKKAQRLDFLFNCVKIGLLPEANTTRYSTIRAALSLLIKHAGLFSEYLCTSCEEVLTLLIPACNHTNREVKNRASAALEAVLGHVSTFMVKTKDKAAGKDNQKLFNTLLVFFNGKLEAKTVDDVSIAIRAFGQLAKAINAFMGQAELLKFFRKLLLMSDRLYSGPVDGVEKSIDHFPSFLSAYAYIIHELSSVEASVVTYLSNMLGRFFLVFPSIVDSRRYKNYTALTRLFVVLYSKGVFQHLLDRVVYQGLALTISKLPESNIGRRMVDYNASAQSDTEAQGYVEYTFLWHHLLGLSPSQLYKSKKAAAKEKTGETDIKAVAGPAWNEGLNLPLSRLAEMQRMLFDQIVGDVLRLLKTLDVRFKPKPSQPRAEEPKADSEKEKESELKHKADAPSGPGSAATGATVTPPGSDLSSQYTPIVPKDYELYLHLVEFCRRFFLLPLAATDPTPVATPNSAAASSTAVVPIASSASSVAAAAASAAAAAAAAGIVTAESSRRALSLWFRPWLLMFGRELIELSAAHPLVSGFYKLISIVFVVSDKFGYFDQLPTSAGTTHLLSVADVKIKMENAAAAAASSDGDVKMGASTSVERKSAARGGAPVVIDLTKAGDDTLDNRLFSFRLFSQFLSEVVTRIQTFKDELLFAAIHLVLSIPKEFIDIPMLLPALKKTLEIGRGYQPAALLGISVLENWQTRMPAHLNAHLSAVLPLLAAYLTQLPEADSGGDDRDGSVPKKSRADSAATMSTSSLVVGGAESMANERAIVMRILNLLGRLGGSSSFVLNAVNESEIALVWDSKSWISFPLPFKDKKIDVHLDSLLPRIAVLAETSIDRKTKVAACEALHSLILYMVARQAMDPNRSNDQALKLHTLYKRLFPVLLRLAVDVEQVSRQLFDPLVRQLIHWFTNNVTAENRDTAALLDAATDAVGHPSDGALREFSANCLGEFLKWSLKQAPVAPISAKDKAAGLEPPTNPMNIKSLLRRLYSLAHHPNPYKRLGACLTFNQIYRQFRESRDLCSRFSLDILYNMLYCLQLSDKDDPSLGTRDEARRVIAHFDRIVTDPTPARYKDLLKVPASKAVQRAGNDDCKTLGSFVEWLFRGSGRLEEVSRRTVHELFRSFAPLTATTGSASLWVANFIKLRGVRAVVDVMEGGGSSDSDSLAVAAVGGSSSAAAAVSSSGALKQSLWVPTAEEWTRPARLNAWFTSLGTALDAYRFCLESSPPLIPSAYLVVGINNVFTSDAIRVKQEGKASVAAAAGDGGNSQLLPAIHAFLNKVQSPALELMAKGLAPSQFAEFQARKCSTAMRLFRFLALITRTQRDTLGFVFAGILDDPAFYTLLFGVLLNPEQNGFSLAANPRRIRQLQKMCGTLIKHVMAGEGGAAAAAKPTKRTQLILKMLGALLREPKHDAAVQFKVQAMANNFGYASVLCNAYHELFNAQLLGSALTAASKTTAPQLAQQLAEQAFALSTSQATPLSPVHRNVSMQMLSLALHIGLSEATLFGYLANSTVIGLKPAEGGDAKADSKAASSSAAAAGGAKDSNFATASYLFYTNNRILLDSYLVNHFTNFAKPLLRAIFNSRELFGVLLNVVQGLAVSKAKHATKLAIAAANANARAGMLIDHEIDLKKDSKLADAATVAADAAADDAGWDAAVAAGSASQAAAAANESSDDSVSLVTTSAALLPGTGAGAVHTAAEINTFITELLHSLGSGFASSGKAGSKTIRPVSELQHPKEEEILLQTLNLFERMIEVDCERVLGVHHQSTEFLLQCYMFGIAGGTASVALKKTALSFLHWIVRRSPLTGQPYAFSDPVLKQMRGLITCPPFPSRSTDLEKDSAVWHQYTGLLESLLRAVVLSKSMPLLESLLPLLRERDHTHGVMIRRHAKSLIEAVCQPGHGPAIRDALERSLAIFMDRALDDSPLNNARFWIVANIAVPLLRIAPLSVATEFFVKNGGPLMKLIEAKPNGPTVSKDIDTQQLEMGELECCYLLLEVLFRRLDKSVAEKAGIVHKTLMQVAHTHIKKTGEKGKAGAVSYLAFHCAAYNCLAAAVARTQNVQKFFDGLCFAENAARGEILWENIVDTVQPLRFEIDTAFEISENPIAFRTQSGAFNLKTATNADSSKYLSSQYLANSSLSQDVSGAFFADAGPRVAAFALADVKSDAKSSSSMEDDETRFDLKEDKKEGKTSLSVGDSSSAADDMDSDVAVHELDALNKNLSMPSILSLIDHMNKEFGARWAPVDMPEWMKALHMKIGASDTHTNVKWFIAKLVVNRWSIFGRYARAWFGPLVTLAIQPTEKNGGVGFHYFLRDISYLFLNWGDFLNDSGATEKDLASRFLAHLMKVAADHGTSTTGKFSRLRDNLKWIKLLVERWRSKISIDKSIIIEHLKAPIVKSDRTGGHGIMRRSVGLQLLAIILANEFPAFDPAEDGVMKEDAFIEALMDNLMSERKTLYAPCAEVYGMVLRSHLREKKTPARDTAHKQYVSICKANLSSLFKKNQYDIYLNILSKLAPKVQADPSLHFLDRSIMNTVFQIFGAIRVHGEFNYMCCDEIEDVFTQLRPMTRRILNDKDVHSHEMLLMIIHRSLKVLTVEHCTELIPELVALFPKHSSVRCREIFYSILIWLYDNNESLMEQKGGSAPAASTSAGAAAAVAGGAPRAVQKLQSALLLGLSDESDVIRDKLYAFWDTEKRLDADIGRRLVQCLSDLYEPDAEDQWLHYVTYLLMHPMRKSADWLRPFSDKPLAEGAFKFEKTSIDTAWTFKSSSMQPLFSGNDENATAAQDPSAGALMFDGDDEEDEKGGGMRRGGMVRATQDAEFSQSITQKSFMDMDEKGMLNSTLDSQKTALLFRIQPAGGSQDAAGSLADFRRSGKKLKRVHGSDRGSAKTGGVAPDRKVYVEGEHVARRFDTGASSASGAESSQEYMIQINSIKKRYKEIWEQRRKQARAATVRLYREYRKGELPDIMCPNKDLLLPLQHLTSTDPVVARQMFLLVFAGVYRDIPVMYEDVKANAIRTDIRGQLNRVMATTGTVIGTSSSPSFVFALHLAQLSVATIEQEAKDRALSASKPDVKVDAKTEAKNKRDKKEKEANELPLFAYEIVPERVGETAYRSSNYHSGVILLEHLLAHPAAPSPAAARAKPKTGIDTTRERNDDVWFELARLYRELGEHDIVKTLFHKHARQNFTKEAIQASLNGEYEKARTCYDAALDMISNKSDWPAGTIAPTQKEVNTWDDERLECLRQMVDWEALHENVCVDLDGDFDKLWDQGSAQSNYMRFFVESSLKVESKRNSLYEFVDKALKHSTERANALIANYGPELVMVFASRNDAPHARYYLGRAYENFLFQWSNLPVLAKRPRAALLRGLQKLSEMNEYLSAMRSTPNSASGWERLAADTEHLMAVWTRRYPSKIDPVHVWDDVIANRTFFLKRLSASLVAAANTAPSAGGVALSTDGRQRLLALQQKVTSANVAGYLKAATNMTKTGNHLVAKHYLGKAAEENKAGRPTADDLFQVEYNTHKFEFEVVRDIPMSDPNAQKTKVTEFWKLIKRVEELERKTKDSGAVSDRKEHANPFLIQLVNGLQAKLYTELAVLVQKNDSLSALCDDEVSAESLYGDAESCHSDTATTFRNLLASDSGKRASGSAASDRLDKSAARAYMAFAKFCERRLDDGLPDEDTLTNKVKREERLPADVEAQLVRLMTENITDAMLLGSADARSKFPRVLDRVARSTRAVRDLFLERTSRIPVWMFIKWISQLLALVGLPEAELAMPTLLRLARSYPQALMFPFNLSKETIEEADFKAPLAAKYLEQLQAPLRSQLIEAFIQSLDGLTNPEIRFKEFKGAVLAALKAGAPAEAKKAYQQFSELCMCAKKDKIGLHIGTANRKFASEVGTAIRNRLGAPGAEWNKTLTYDAVNKILSDIDKDFKPIKHGPGRLVEFSEWLTKYEEMAIAGDQYIELPGQYSGNVCPQPERHIRIVGFDSSILVMSSLRKPKRLTIHANDERNYPFLIKGGEDLRMDQRIQQLFGAMQDIVKSDPKCVSRDLYLRTYQVVPLTRNVGMIEWLPNTTPLKSIITDQAKVQKVADPTNLISTHYNAWIMTASRMAKPVIPHAFIHALEHAAEKDVISNFERIQALVPTDLLLRGVSSLCASPESFLVVRSRFARTYATFTICSYILGIGDRHLDNFLMDTSDGSLVGIDFGAAFGAGIGLGVPELMPFRMTRQFQHFCRPLETVALLKQDMVYALAAVKRNQEMLITLMDVFIKEPQLDWIANAKSSRPVGAAGDAKAPAAGAAAAALGSGSAAPLSSSLAGGAAASTGASAASASAGTTSSLDNEVSRYTRDRIRVAKRKLRGDNPATVMAAELASTKLPVNWPNVFRNATAYVLGKGKLRSKNGWKQCATVAEQVDALVDLATDPNILGRTWGGWMPFC